MADITIFGSDCDDERSERGPRGHRGHRGHEGPTGPTGSTGPPGPGAGVQRFVYTADGTEGTSFDIPLQTPRLDANYVAQVTGGGLAFQLTFDTPISGYTTTQIHVNSSGVLTAGDKLIVVIGDLT